MSKNIEASVKKITEKGYTKSKAQKALKECNNNVQQALKLLENQALAAEKAAKAEELIRQKEIERREKEELRALRREQGLPEDSDEERALQEAAQQKIRLHPCIQQYGNCKFGKYCHFRYLPGDTCVNYLLGNCIYDEKCRNRHTYEGEDLRKYVKEMQQEDVVYEDEKGSYYTLNPTAKGKVLVPEFRGETYDPREAWAGPAPLPSAFDTTDGAEPTYTEPVSREALWEDEKIANANNPAPQPFLERLKTGLEAKIAEKSNLTASASSWVPLSASKKPTPKVTVVGGGASQGVLSAKTRFAPEAKAKHPCIFQMGSCMFGDKCAHKDKPADICVFFLNGKCRLSSDECEFRHEKSALKQDEKLLSEDDLMLVHGRAAMGGSRISSLIAESIPPSSPTTIAPPTGVATDYLFEIENETEEMSFYFLKEAFPYKDDLDLIQALRLGGSRDAAVDLLLEFDEVDRQHASRIEHKLQEREALEQIDQAERTERLITLCQLFPNMEVGAIEDTMASFGDDFDAAFRHLQCRVEHVVQTDKRSKWTPGLTRSTPTLSAADKLKLDRLYAMFPDLPAEVVEDVYAEAGTIPLSVDTLRHLTHDLNDITDGDRAAADRMRTYHSVAGKASGSGAASASSTSTSSFTVSTPPQQTSTSFKVSTQPNGSSFAVRAGNPAGAVDSGGKFISDTDFYKQVVSSANGTEDWRRLRQEAMMINRARIQCISLAGNAYNAGNGKAAKSLGSRARQLGILYEKMNILAMHALEAEGKGAGITILDLHGFRRDEALDVLKRRLELCARRKSRKLRIVMGRGSHSEQGRAVLFPLVVEHMRSVEPFCSLGEIVSVNQAHVDVEVIVSAVLRKDTVA